MPGSVSDTLQQRSPQFRERVLTELYRTHPQTRLWFPANADDAHTNLVFALTFILDHEPDEELVANLAREHRAFGLTSDIAQSGMTIIRKALREFCADLPFPEVKAADDRLRWLTTVMCQTLDDTPPPGWGKVAQVQRRARRITVVRLECPVPPHYLPGQYLAVSSPLIQGYWKHLAPAMPANPDGFIEFHLFDRPELEGLAVSQPGDTWFFSQPHGNLRVSGERDLLLLAESTGYAAIRCILLDMLSRGMRVRTHLFFGAEFPGELYELASLWQLAAASPWLSVTPVVDKPADEWWVNASDHARAPRGLHLQQVGSVGDVVTSYGAWADRDVVLSGEPTWVERTRAQLIDAGTPEAQIQSLAL